MKKESIDYAALLSMPLWQMTGQEFCLLTKIANSDEGGESSSHARSCIYVTGVRALADYLNCCESTVFSLRRNGVLDNAIISHIGRKIVFNAEVARSLAAEYQNKQKSERR